MEQIKQLLEQYPYLTLLTYGGNEYVGIIQNCDEQITTIYDIAADPEEWAKLLENTKVRNRGGRTAAGNIFECFRINLGSVVMFKATTAKYLYKKFKAKSVLDPTAGWGGRMLGAWSLGINYTGIDTNVEMIPAYNDMMAFLKAETGFEREAVNALRTVAHMLIVA